MPASKLRPVLAQPRRASQRLRDALRARPGSLVLVHAGAGYGKTTVLAASHDRTATWYNLDATDGEPAVLARRLMLAMHLPPPPTGTTSTDALVLELARHLQSPPAELTLDRWERLGDDVAAGRFLEELLQLSPGLTVRVATGRRPALPLERMRLEGRLVDVGPGTLRLDRTEIAEALLGAWRRPPSRDEIDFADAVLEGWPAGIQVWAAALDSADLFIPLLPGGPLREYFDEHVLGLLPNEVQDDVHRERSWLAGSGPLLERANNSRRRELLGRLVRDRVAVVPRADGWCSHPLLAAFARMRARRRPILDKALPAVGTTPGEIAENAAPPLAVRTLGGLRVLRHGVAVPGTAWPASSRRLFELLLSVPGHRTTAREAAELLWPSSPYRAAHNSFNVALHGLRRALEPGLSSGSRSRYVVREGPAYQLRVDNMQCDADEFTRLVREVGQPLDDSIARRLRAAAELYTGDFLATSADQFIVERRTHLRGLMMACVEALEGSTFSDSTAGDLTSRG